MNASLRDLKHRADGLTPPPFDIDDIVAKGDARLGRRRAALVAGTAGVAAAVIAAGVVVNGSTTRSDAPADDPTPSVTETLAPGTRVRQLAYADVPAEQAPNWRIGTIHYGDLELRLGEVLHLDVTDDGLVVLAEDGTIYFSDGSSVEELGTTSRNPGFSDADVKASAAGSLLAWFTDAGPDRALTVYDTHEGTVVAQVPAPDCVADLCRVVTVVGDRVYWSESDPPSSSHPLRMLEVSTGAVSDTDATSLAAYLRTVPRGFVKGDSFADGEVVTYDVSPENVYFEPQGSTLELRRVVDETEGGEAVYGYGGFDTTGRRLHLRLPDGYPPADSDYVLFQWLDDDRFAVMSGAAHNDMGWNGFRGYGDILLCDIAEDRCTLAVPGPTDDDYRIVPHLDVPN
jgi:hypothetical protein